jgi:hypothetical protein
MAKSVKNVVSGKATTKTKDGKPVKKAAKPREPVEKTPGLNIGMKNGKRLVETVNDLLVSQRRIAYDDPRKLLDDETLLAMIGKEFPLKEGFQTMSSYRNYFNAGLAGMGDPPGNKIPKEGKRLLGKDIMLRRWAQNKFRPKVGPCPEKLAEQILKVKSEEE